MTIFVFVAVVLGVWASLRLKRVAACVCSYKAKTLASALFVSELDVDPDHAPEVSADAYRLMRLFRARVDRERKTVTISCLGLQPRSAVWRPGYGATLAASPLKLSPVAPVRRRAELESVTVPLLRPHIDAAFSEPDPKRLRRTRAVIVVQDGVVIAERYAPGITADTRLNGWSMTKSVTGILMGTLITAGKASLTDTRLLSEWGNPGDRRADISLEDLLRMRSGLRFTEIYTDALSDVTRMLFDSPDAAGYAASRRLEAPPGTHWKYSSGTTNILSLIARRAVGETEYPSWPRRSLFDPIGMSSAIFETDAAGTFVGSSFLFATARDWARFGLTCVDDGVIDGRRLLPEGWMRLATTPTPQAPNGCYGAHWWLKLSKELGGETAVAGKIPHDAFHALGHEGQCLTIIPSRRLVVVRLGLSIDITSWNHAAFVAGLLDVLPS